MNGIHRCAIAFAAFVCSGIFSIAVSGEDVGNLLFAQTRELYAAVDSGDAAVWEKYLDTEMVYTKEDGSFNTKKQLVDDIKPFPPNIWGKLAVEDFRARVHGNVAVTTYLIDETEGYFGQVIKAKYLSTDTWIKTAKGWRMIATAALALRDDPPAIALSSAQLDEYVGTYALTATVHFVVKRVGDHLEAQRDDRKPVVLTPEVADCFFVPGDPRIRKVFQRDVAGHITGFVERRESWDIAWKKIS